MRRLYRKLQIRPARCPFFYGWVILACGTLGMLMSIPGQTMGVSVFTDPLLEALGLGRVQLSLAYLVGTVASALLLTHVGRLYDRYGARTVGPVGSAGLGLVLLALTQADHVARALSQVAGLDRAVAAFVTMMVGFLLLRLLGQGVLTMVSRSMAMKWFDRRRGLANAILGLFVSFGFSFAPQGFSVLIGWYGWRGAWGRMGLLIGGGFSIVAWLLFRDTPESVGLRPDGDLPAPQTPDAPAPLRHDAVG